MSVKINDSIIDSSGMIHRDERDIAWFSDLSYQLARIGTVEKAVFKPCYNAFQFDFKEVEIVKRPKHFKLNEDSLMRVNGSFARGEGVQPPFQKYDVIGILSKVLSARTENTSEYKDCILHKLKLNIGTGYSYNESLAEYHLF